MFNRNFYPTPEHVINLMGIDTDNKTVLEPSAGKGDLIQWLKKNGAKEVLSCELNEDLAEIVKTKSKFLQHDFLKVKPEEISHIDLIVMNPPFSNGDRHLLHAWNTAPDGCEIISLLNNESLRNDYSQSRRELTTIINDYGNSQNLGNVFNDAERETDRTDIALIKLFKPKQKENEFDGFFLDEDDEQPQGNGIMPFNAIRDVVQRYIYSVKCFERFEVIKNEMNQLTSLFNVGGFTFNVGYEKNVCTKSDFKREIQKNVWIYLFKEMNLTKYLTSGVAKEINNFCENQQNVPFTMKNIYRMFDIIIGTREQIFEKALVEALDNFTRHTDENRYNVEGWKTNAGHMLNQKFIVNYMCEPSFRKDKLEIKYSGNQCRIEDLIKVLCNITSTNFTKLPSLSEFCKNVNMQPNTWYSWDFKTVIGEGENQTTEFTPGFFEIKGFKKGTIHFKFQNLKVWEQVNRAYAKAKGQVLPENL